MIFVIAINNVLIHFGVTINDSCSRRCVFRWSLLLRFAWHARVHVFVFFCKYDHESLQLFVPSNCDGARPSNKREANNSQNVRNQVQRKIKSAKKQDYARFFHTRYPKVYIWEENLDLKLLYI